MSNKLNLLSGTAVKTEKGLFYLKNGKRLRIPSRNILRSWRFYKVVKTDEESVSHYPVMGVLPFRDGTLVYCIADGKYYIVSSAKLVHITDPQVIKDHGLKRRNAFIISQKERDVHGVAK